MQLTIVAAIGFGCFGDPAMTTREVESILREGTSAAKNKILRDVFFASPRRLDPKRVPSDPLFQMLQSSDYALKEIATIYLGNREWKDSLFLQEFSRIAGDQKEHFGIRRYAIHFICMRSTDCLDLLSGLMQDKEVRIRRSVADNLAHLEVSKANASALQALYVRAFHDTDPDVRFSAASALSEAARAKRAILELPKGSDPLTCAFFYAARVSLEPNDKQSIAQLLVLLHNEESIVRESAAKGLHEARYFDPKQVDLLNEALMDNSPNVRGSICFLAGLMPANQARLLSNLASCLEDGDHEVREWAVYAAGAMNERAYLPQILRALRTKGKHWRLRYNALEALVRIGDNSPEVIEAIRETVKLGHILKDEGNSAIRQLRVR